MKTEIVAGSIGAIAQQSGKSIAESFLSCDVVIIVDTSGSMSANDSRNGLSRYKVACQELKQLQENMPGKIAVINFSSTVQFEPGGVPFNLGGGTDLLSALRFVKPADQIEDMKFILISDGGPEDPESCIKFARGFKNKISTIYVGPEEIPTGRDFLERLAKASGGQVVTADRAKELGTKVTALLGA